MKTTAHDIAEARDSIANKLAHNTVRFTCTCPKCRRRVQQHAYSRAVLVTFLDLDHPIDAYCPTCDEVWAIGDPERHALAEGLSGSPAGATC